MPGEFGEGTCIRLAEVCFGELGGDVGGDKWCRDCGTIDLLESGVVAERNARGRDGASGVVFAPYDAAFWLDRVRYRGSKSSCAGP